MKKLHCLVLLALLLSCVWSPQTEARYGMRMLRHKHKKNNNRLNNALSQVNLSPQQQSQISSIERSTPKGKMQKQQVMSVLSPQQRKQVQMILRNTPKRTF